MTITTTTPSGRIGIKRTDMIEDIRIIIQGSKAKLGGLTERGLAWLYYNMWTPAWSQGITIDKENVDEIKQLIEKDGLIVKEK